MTDTFCGHRLLLVGRTGNGKSATGNSILGKKEFQSRSATSAIKYDVRMGRGTNGGVPLEVVDGPGLGDTSTDITETGHSMNALVEAALALINNRFHALVLVLKYGVRLTAQETNVIHVAKMVFGADVFTRFGIVAMTHGDHFEMDTEDDPVTFEEWCGRQVGEAASLFGECGMRCVLFNNVTSDDDKKHKQIEKLMTMVESIKRSGPPYSEEDFQRAHLGRQKLVVMGKMPRLVAETENFLARVNRRLEEQGQVKQNESTSEVQNTICEIQKISDELQEHKMRLQAEDEGTQSVEHLLLQVSLLESRVRTMIDLRRRRLEMALLNSRIAGELSDKLDDAKLENQTKYLWEVFFFCILIAPVIVAHVTKQ